MATSAPVTVTVVAAGMPITIISAMAFNPQTGLFQETVRVENPSGSGSNVVRLDVHGLTNAMVWNASGTNNAGIPYVQSSAPVPAGGYVDFIIEYYVPGRILPNPTLTAELVEPAGQPGPVGIGQHINRGVLLPDRTFLIEFASVSNRIYYIQYSSDLANWKTAYPAIQGNGTYILWIDNGLPKTESSPATVSKRFYRLLALP
jgi:hypothetical protein